ncbi:hypothetical protein DRF65_16645 [Chryseobacterium pennae]|uniref:Carrier domain-containing protein n=1 Tax=Chryseobacterium pennae TaxID=2258962 RepID=A0A3D9C657_9FLAO|nr:non-ribosomal peptide synthetase [Chryseobacterium pennae]REC61343.1 hypothetical protein DRF65_16645 [Chryseobacterium pennae]
MTDIQILSNIFWKNKIKDKEEAVFSKGKIEILKKQISKKDLESFIKISRSNPLSKFSIVSSIFSFLVNKYFENFQNVIKIYPSNLIDLDEILLLEIESNAATFKELLQNVANEVKKVLPHKYYNSSELTLELFSNFSIQFGQKAKVLKDDISLLYEETEDSIILTSYYQDSYLKCVIEGFLANFINILSNYNTLLDIELVKYSLVTDDKDKILLEFNSTEVEYSDDKTIVDLFEEQVEKNKNNIAILFNGLRLTYREFNERANQLGNYLRQNYQIQADDLVAIKLERSENMLLAILGIMKSGAAYVPIDPEYPQDRITYIEMDARAKITIDLRFLLKFDSEKENYSRVNLPIVSKANSLAYVIYTSGTTGHPKGVMIEHHSLINRLTWMQKAYSLTAEDTLIQKTTYSFDVSVWELIWWMLHGAKVSILASGSEKNPTELIDNIVTNKVTIIHFVPSMLQMFLNYLKTDSKSLNRLKSLRQVFVSGEALTLHQRNLFYELFPDVSLMNLYGPTEASIDVTYYDCREEKSKGSVPIGKPIDNTRIYILDERKVMVPIGVPGTLYISGVGLSRGYLNKPELTSEKFVDNPFNLGTKMYDTGDLAKWLPDGNIEFLGRKDFQVKIRGYRIELGEIETNISQFSTTIKQVIADAKEVNGEKVLIAYYTTDNEAVIGKTELREYLQSKLPEYMVPGFFVELESIPLTPNGKIDRKALPSVTGEDLIRREYVAPRNEMEQKLADIWQEVLGVEKVGVTDNFFELGGHSLMVAQVLSRIHQTLAMQISFKDFFASPIIEGITKNFTVREYTPIPKAPEQESYPLTPSQQRLWVLSQLEGGSQAYNMPAVVTLRGGFNEVYFEKAFQYLIDRHEILRTSFKSDILTGEIRQYIAPKEEIHFTIEVLDFAGKNDFEIEEYLQSANNEVFNLEESPLIRASLLKRDDEENLFFLSMHHIVGDGWSTQVLVSEIVETYNKLLKDGDITINTNVESEKVAPLSIQYKDYAVWQQEEVKGERYQKAEVYWLEQFEGELPVLELPSYKTRPLIQTYNGDNISHFFSQEFTEKLKKYSEKQGVTLFMTLMAGVKTLLYRYTGQKDIIVGTPIAGREYPDLENQIGLYLNTLALRTRLEEGYNTFNFLLHKEKDFLLSAYEHQIYPFDELVGKLNIKRDSSRSALFDVLVVFQNQSQLRLGGNIRKDIEGLQVEEYEYNRKTSQFDVSYMFAEEYDQLKLTIEYNTDIYEAFLIQRMFAHFENLLTKSIEDTEGTTFIEDINYLTGEERHQLLIDFNDTKVDYPSDKTIIELFEEQVCKTPDNVAVVFEDTELSYRELNEQVNQLGDYLRQNYHIVQDDLVAIKLERSEKMIVAILGILKSGGAYVPIDPEYPQERIAYLEQDTNAKVTIDEVFLASFQEEIRKSQDCYTKDNLTIISRPDSLAYVIYTSGTTGYPKGVMIENKSVINLILGQTEEFKLENNESVILISNYTFDASVEQIFLALLNGLSLHVVSKEIVSDPKDLLNYLTENNITHLHTVPNILERLDFSNELSLNRIISGGDIFPQRLLNKLNKYKFCFYNEYGPTETTVTSIEFLYSGKGDILIGRPISNTKVYILDEELNVLPIGVPGVLYISGAGLSRGYLNKPELTAEKFVENPFDLGSKMYDTGDLARWLPDGNIEFLGRKDFQVKIRGYRIELGEIETHISQFSSFIRQVIVDAKEVNGEKVLIAYYTTDTEDLIDKTELRDYLQSKLPEYMVPVFFVELEFIPLTPNGKIDRKALPSVTGEDLIRREYVAPRNEMEQKLADIWQEVLVVEKVGVTDNFFELGGHSLMVAQVINRMYQNLTQQISFKDFFSQPIIEKQIYLLKDDRNRELDIKKYPNINNYIASSTQTSIWLKEHMEKPSLYNLVHVTKLEGSLDIIKLEKAFKNLVQNEEIFRTSFIREKDHLIAKIEENAKISIQHHWDIKELDIIIKNEKIILFDLEKPPLLRVNLISSNQLFYVVITFHHIALDGLSIHKFYEKLVGYYVDIPPLYNTPSFKDYMIWRNEENQQNIIRQQRELLIKKFSDVDVTVNIPHIRKEKQVYKGSKRYIYNYSGEQLENIKRIKNKYNTTIFNILLAGLHGILYKYSKQNTIVTVVPIANRDNHSFEDTLGFFMNTILIKSEFEENISFGNLVNQIKLEFLEGISNNLCLLEDWASYSNNKILPHLNIMASFQNYSDVNQYKIKDIKVNQYPVIDNEGVAPLYNLVFRFFGNDENLYLEIEYDTSLVDESYVQRFLNHLNILLKKCIENDNLRIEMIDIVLDEEREKILNFNKTEFEFPEEKNFIELFENTAFNMAKEIAVEYNENILSYEELNDLSNIFARYLLSKLTIKYEDRICVKINKSHHLIYILLGILKTGACYVPIDPTYPEERKEYLEKLSDAIFYIDDNTLEEFLSQRNIYSKKNIEVAIPSTSLFHIMFTSGSTGAPKGVMLTHRNIVNFVTTNNYFPLNRDTILLSTVASSFDTTNMEFWGVLVNGGKLIIADRDDLFDYNILEKLIISKNVNSLWLTASWFSQIAEQRIGIFEHLKQFISGGDILSLKHINMVREKFPNLLIINGYGPTENTTFSTTYKVQGNEFITLPIGKPLANTQVHILSESLLYDPIGVIGTIYLSGENIAKGYFNNEKLTSERFIDNPHLENGILYNTGDLGRWLPDGNIEFFGRNDFQVKIRGYRVELDEIENKILQFSEDIKQTVVISEFGKSLIAYLTIKDIINTQYLKEYLLEKLPRYMVPDLFIILEEIPLTPNGKIDRKFLSSIEKSELINLKKLRPETINEKGICEIWETVLGLQNINIDDNFFDIGGNSLLLMELITKLNEKFKKTIRINELYKFATIKEQALLVDNDKQQVQPISNEEVLGITLNQKRWLVTNLMDINSLSNKNIVNTFDLYGDTDIKKVTDFFKKLVEKHDILRTRYYFEDNLYKSETLPVSEVEIKLELHEEDSETIINELKDHFYNLNQPPLFKVAISRSKLYLSMHHLVSDAWSFKVLIEEWQEYLKNGNISTENIISYKDFLKNDEQYFRTKYYVQDRDFWLNEFKLFEETKFPEIPNNSNEEGKIIFYFQDKDFKNLNEISEITGKSINLVLTTVYYKTLSQVLNNNDITIGIPIAGRDDFNRMCIGFFVKMLMIRVDTSGNWLDTLKTVENKINLCNYHSNYPYDSLIKDLDLPIYQNRFPLSSVFFNLVDINLSLEKIVSTEFLYKKIENSFSRYDLNSYVYVYSNCVEVQSQINISKINESLAKTIFDIIKININDMYNYFKV